MDLQEIYKKETGFDVGKIHDTGTTYYSDDYVKWLEKRLSVSGVRDYALECLSVQNVIGVNDEN